MPTPGFTAEESLGRTPRAYRGRSAATGLSDVQPSHLDASPDAAEETEGDDGEGDDIGEPQ